MTESVGDETETDRRGPEAGTPDSAGGSDPIKRYGDATAPTFHPFPGGFTWIAHPDETMHRASHALAVAADGALLEGRSPVEDEDPSVYLVEPIDCVGLDDRVADLGTVAGVLVLAGLHRRDSAAVANRHGVPVYLPGTVGGLKHEIDAPIEFVEGTLPGTDLRTIPVLDGFPWSEAALYDAATGTLVATEVLVTSDRATGWGERLSVGPYARPVPPRGPLGDLDVERVLVGHGAPVLEDAQPALETALARSYRGLPGYLLKDLAFMLKAGYVAMRD